MSSPTHTFEEMIAHADSRVDTLTPEQANERLSEPGFLLVDIRDIRELERNGRIKGARHVPRGMLEFWMHPDSPYYRDYLGEAKEVVLYCNRGWRSAVAASQLKDVGLKASHMSGGFTEWNELGYEVEKPEPRR
jgi:rhodanese-related sulfurtransferase